MQRYTLLVATTLVFSSSTAWLRVIVAAQKFNFPDGVGGNSNELTRQQTTNVSTGIITGILTGTVPLQTGITGTITTSGVAQTCICVPTGRCNSTPATTDGSGMLDVRIVTSAVSTNASSVITPNIVTPATCVAGLERCCMPGGYQCGLQFPPVASARQPGPGQASYGEYPWQAVLLGPGDIYVGSGALVDALNVITVAHRVSEYLSGSRPLRVRMGEWDASAASEPIPAQEFNVVKIFIHPSYTSSNLKNDIAMLRLSSAVNLGTTPTITTACLPATSFVGNRCWISGWGKNDFVNGAYQAIQKEVDVPVRSTIDCEAALRTTRLGPSFQLDSTSFMCAGGETGKDACTGDGGSPLVCALGGRYFVVGLVAWGIGCGTTNIPGVYVNVASFVPWIMSTVISN
ncbi:phenoloxidase-activating factor 2-like [Topomyia yanbarensis]|uniref:phenoloxidase-activating factor 2-like n=1 Tax=Topomyia yanbarensis TaxID=2498891 RepID=UPI00273C2500|nr:phenoloxidase-activating factor 2-like [Topomyia yanbarensis]